MVAYDQSADAAWDRARSEVGLFLLSDELATPTVIRRPTVGPRGDFRLTIPAAPKLFSLELFSENDSLAARARYGLPLRRVPPGMLAISSLLVTEPASPLPDDLDRAAQLALGSLRVRPGQRLGLYWEIYGIGERPEPLTVWLVAGKLDEAGRLATDATGMPLSLRWENVAPAKTAIWPRSMTVDLPADLTPGRYVFFLQVAARRREPVSCLRMFLVER